MNFLKYVSAPLLLLAFFLFAAPAFAGNISSVSGEHYAWSDSVGWIDFDASVTVSDGKLTGNPNTLQIGLIALDCAGSPNGNICGGSAGDWWVANDGSGNLSGWAWSDSVGWISFCGNSSAGSGATGGCPTSPTYQVKIDPVTGDFSGWAWNDVMGWISFNCNNSGIGDQCPISDYKVKTSWTAGPPPPAGGPGDYDADTWLISSIFDTQVSGGAAFNSISWQGVQPQGTGAAFQIASSNDPGGPWNYLGPDGTDATLYEPLVNTQAKISRRYHNNHRYVRYKVWLKWSGSEAPEVKDVIISYSP